SLAPAIPITEMIPAAAITLKMKFKTYVLSILLRPFQVYLWGVFDKIEHLFLFCDFIIPPNFQKSIGFDEKIEQSFLLVQFCRKSIFNTVKILRKNQNILYKNVVLLQKQ
ncbi:MAG: hypothetical protein IIV40_02470, partial [Oscillospiraceae bacterium]|nr:hypothetical protein [Oscillospiraceae bacterium]